MKYLRTYNENVNQHYVDNFLSKLEGFDIDNSIFYRAHNPDSNLDAHILLEPKIRTSKSSSNLQNVVLSQYDYLPCRVKSITFSDKETVGDFAKNTGTHFIYNVIPQNNIQIAIAPVDDINTKTVNSFINKYYEDSYVSNYKFFNALGNTIEIITDKDFIYDWNKPVFAYDSSNYKNFKLACDSIENKLRMYDYEPKESDLTHICKQIYPIYKFFKEWLRSDKSFYDYLIEVFEPIKAGYKVVDFNWTKMKDESFRNQFIGKECWIDTPCLLINKIDVW